MSESDYEEDISLDINRFDDPTRTSTVALEQLDREPNLEVIAALRPYEECFPLTPKRRRIANSAYMMIKASEKQAKDRLEDTALALADEEGEQNPLAVLMTEQNSILLEQQSAHSIGLVFVTLANTTNAIHTGPQILPVSATLSGQLKTYLQKIASQLFFSPRNCFFDSNKDLVPVILHYVRATSRGVPTLLPLDWGALEEKSNFEHLVIKEVRTACTSARNQFKKALVEGIEAKSPLVTLATNTFEGSGSVTWMKLEMLAFWRYALRSIQSTAKLDGLRTVVGKTKSGRNKYSYNDKMLERLEKYLDKLREADPEEQSRMRQECILKDVEQYPISRTVPDRFTVTWLQNELKAYKFETDDKADQVDFENQALAFAIDTRGI